MKFSGKTWNLLSSWEETMSESEEEVAIKDDSQQTLAFAEIVGWCQWLSEVRMCTHGKNAKLSYKHYIAPLV